MFSSPDNSFRRLAGRDLRLVARACAVWRSTVSQQALRVRFCASSIHSIVQLRHFCLVLFSSASALLPQTHKRHMRIHRFYEIVIQNKRTSSSNGFDSLVVVAYPWGPFRPVPDNFEVQWSDWIPSSATGSVQHGVLHGPLR